MTQRPPSIRRLLLFTAAAGIFGCGGNASGPGPEDLVDREVFIATYVDLRVAALTSESGEVTDGGRAEALTRNGVTEQQLVSFVDVHGEELDFMRDVWNDIELRLDAQHPPVDDPR